MRRTVALLILLLFIFPASTSAASARTEEKLVYSRYDNLSNKIALTFDDGPHPRYTAEILDILSEYGIPATFFVIGQNAELYPELVKQEIDAGHEIGNHTFSHKSEMINSSNMLINELERAHETIYEADEYSTKLFRPPEGKYNKNSKSVARLLDYKVVLWNIDTRDWAHTPSDKIAENVIGNVKSGDIILFHDFISEDSPTPDALRKIIPALLERGFVFVTVSELIGSE